MRRVVVRASEVPPRLLLATAADHAAGTAESVVLEHADLADICERATPLLIVLNCCLGAAPASGGTQSLASDLVYRYGFPAVIGMREQVLPACADTFAAALYPEILAMLAELSAANVERAVVDWSRLMVRPRRRLCESRQQPGGGFSAAAATTKEWTLPVLYVRPAACEVNVTPAALPSADQLKLQLLRGMLASTPPGAPATYRDGLATEIGWLEREHSP